MRTATMVHDYHVSLTANISSREAFGKISKVSAWWATDFEGASQKQGDVFTVTFGKTFVIFEIAEVVKDRKIVWQVLDCHLHWLRDKKEWNGTEIVWEISSHNGSTRIDMTHVGLVPEVECYEMCEKGWNHHIKESLFPLMTEDKGYPQGGKGS